MVALVLMFALTLVLDVLDVAVVLAPLPPPEDEVLDDELPQATIPALRAAIATADNIRRIELTPIGAGQGPGPGRQVTGEPSVLAGPFQRLM